MSQQHEHHHEPSITSSGMRALNAPPPYPTDDDQDFELRLHRANYQLSTAVSFAIAKYFANKLDRPSHKFRPKSTYYDSSTLANPYLSEDEPTLDGNDSFETDGFTDWISCSYGHGVNDPTRPPFETSVAGLSSSSAMRALTRLRYEGFSPYGKVWCQALWFHDIGSMLLQPNVENLVNDALGLQFEVIPLTHVENVMPYLFALASSYTITEVLLSPLELVRTRLIAQTLHPVHRKYYGTGDCLRKIVEEEGLSQLYFNRALLPTVLHYGIQSIFRFGTQLVLERTFNLSSEENPILYQLSEFALKSLEILVTMPLETVRRRMYCQLRKYTDKPLETVVSCNKIPYTGMIDCMGRLMTEEEVSRGKKNKEKPSWSLGPLYRGLRLRLFANASIIFLRIFTQ
ncbi:mitochondrial carrier domain-containing protein [Chytridium lagenaria]|nr:mitochondrial carrier domain-containing protein [Chytridium lagenaria]